jgi:putative endonuclease
MASYEPAAGCVHSCQQAKRDTLHRRYQHLAKRTWQHKNDRAESFTKEYGVHTLVYYEVHATMLDAIQREKRLKKWNRVWKLELIEKVNPEWKDLSSTIV